MYEKYIRKTFHGIAIALAVLCFSVHPCPVLADGLAGSLEVCYRTGETLPAAAIDGAVFTLYQIADHDEGPGLNSGHAEYDLMDMSAEAMDELSEKLSREAKEGGISGVTDMRGTVTFSDLAPGIYLVKQTGSTGKSEKYETAKPFLVSIPSEEGYDVICYPKTAAKKTIVPKTGDILGSKEAIIVLFASGAIGGVLLISGRRKGGNERC